MRDKARKDEKDRERDRQKNRNAVISIIFKR